MDEKETQAAELEEKSSWSLARVAGLVLIVIAALIALYLTVGYVAWQSGESLRIEREENLRDEQVDRQVDLAQEDISNGSYSLALRRLAWVLEQDPGREVALALKQQAQAALKNSLTPEAPPTATIAPNPTPTSEQSDDRALNLQRLQQLEMQEAWPQLIDDTLAFQRQNPEYERLKTDALLYHAHLSYGLAQIQGDQIETGIYHLSQAEKLGDLTQEALDYWLWAELYLQGMAYYGVNWEAAASFFRDLCLAAPFYQGSCDKLYDALVGQGDQFANVMEWCPAVDLYREARQYGQTQTLNEKISEAAQGCAEATPTPEVISGTLPITDTESISPLPGGE